eukprot:5719324-Amphidinium_carterae.1
MISLQSNLCGQLARSPRTASAAHQTRQLIQRAMTSRGIFGFKQGNLVKLSCKKISKGTLRCKKGLSADGLQHLGDPPSTSQRGLLAPLGTWHAQDCARLG